MSATETEPQTTEEKRDALYNTVSEADSAWYADIENADLKAAYKAAKDAFREFENAAIDKGATEKCYRCGGSGGWVGWPGFTCYRCNGAGREPMRKSKFQAAPNIRFKKESKIDAEIAEKDAAYAAAIADLGDVGSALDTARIEVRDYHAECYHDYDDPKGPSRETGFRADLATKLWRFGSLSEAQVAAVRKGIERETAREAEKAAAGPLAEGEYEITGEIVSTKWQESKFGTTKKMLVKLDDGNKVFGTFPSKLGDADKGSRVTFTATVERSEDDEHFGFFKSPKQARLAEEPLLPREVELIEEAVERGDVGRA